MARPSPNDADPEPRPARPDPHEQRVPAAGPPAEHDDIYPAEIEQERGQPLGEGDEKPRPEPHPQPRPDRPRS